MDKMEPGSSQRCMEGGLKTMDKNWKKKKKRFRVNAGRRFLTIKTVEQWKRLLQKQPGLTHYLWARSWTETSWGPFPPELSYEFMTSFFLKDSESVGEVLWQSHRKERKRKNIFQLKAKISSLSWHKMDKDKDKRKRSLQIETRN